MGVDITGRLASEVYQGEYRAFLLALYRQAVERRSCILSHGEFTIAGGASLSTTRLLMPLSSDGQTIDIVAYHNNSSISTPHALGPSGPRLPHSGVEKMRLYRCDYL
jgi:hypothetical protein